MKDVKILDKMRIILRKHILPITAVLFLLIIGIGANSIRTEGVKEVDIIQELEEVVAMSDPKDKYFCDWSQANFKLDKAPVEVKGPNGQVTGYFLELELIAPEVRERHPEPG